MNVAQAKRTNQVAASDTAKRLRASVDEANRCGYAGYEFRLRLVLGELEMRYGRPAAGKSELERLVQDSKAKGFDLVARRAAEKLADSQGVR
jgi:hypothetical protein